MKSLPLGTNKGLWDQGVQNNGATSGLVVFGVPYDSPFNVVYYQSGTSGREGMCRECCGSLTEPFIFLKMSTCKTLLCRTEIPPRKREGSNSSRCPVPRICFWVGKHCGQSGVNIVVQPATTETGALKGLNQTVYNLPML